MARILVLEDDRVGLVLLRQCLAQGLHEVVCVSDARRLLDAIADECADLVIASDAMPGLGGALVHRAIRERIGPWMPVIVLTAASRARRAETDPLLAYVRRPIVVRELLGAIRELLRKRQLANPAA